MTKIKTGNIGYGDWGALADAANRLAPLDVLIDADDGAGLSVLDARTKARRALRNSQGKGLIIIDYLQLMEPASHRREINRTQEVSEISRGLKMLAKELDVPIIALSQLSRDIEKRPAKQRRPMLSDLRESGAIEQDADIVMFIDRSISEEEAERNDRPSYGEANLIVAKHRNGEVRDIKLAFIAECTKFQNFVDDSRVW